MKTLEQRFWTKVDKRGSEDCWLWIGCKTSIGYGWISLGKKSSGGTHAHRAAWTLIRGTIPEGMHILHTCDVRACVNPAHLFLGTHQDNMDDMVRKGRRTRLMGEANGLSKLTAPLVRAIRSSSDSQRLIALRYGLNQSTVSRICNRSMWAHVQ